MHSPKIGEFMHGREPDEVVSSEARGDPMSARPWAAKATFHVADALCVKGYAIRARTVGDLSAVMGYPGHLQEQESTLHVDRDAQFSECPAPSSTISDHQAGSEVVKIYRERHCIGQVNSGIPVKTRSPTALEGEPQRVRSWNS
jgi:Rhodopirellula transposase DDE domain